MLAYIFLIGTPAILAIIFTILKTRYKCRKSDLIIIDMFFCLWLILLIFRSTKVGTDLLMYKHHFNSFSIMKWKDLIGGIVSLQFEMGFALVSKFVSIFTSEFQWVIVCCAFLSVIPIWRFYRKEARHAYLMIVLFVNIAPFAIYFSGLRQALALACSIPCYYYCKDKKILKFLLTVFLAYLIHHSAFILLVMYPMYHVRIKRMVNLLYLIPIIGVIYVYKMPIFKLLITFLGDSYIEDYASSIKETGAKAVLFLLIVLLIYTYFIVDVKQLDDDTIGLRNLLILSVIIQVFAGVHTVSMRMNYYFLIFIPVLITRIIEKGRKDIKLITQLSIICMIGFFTYYFFHHMFTGSDELEIYPYISIFSNY